MIFRRAARGPVGLLAALLLFASAVALFAQFSNLPPRPDRYITDHAGVLDAGTLDSINSQLEQFEKDTSNQIVVAIYSTLPPQTDVAYYATALYNSWQIGQKGKNNGALLLIAVNDRKLFITTGRGLEGSLPDATCKNIVTYVITPHFKQGDYAGGIESGIQAMIAATKGEYQGTGSTVDDSHGGGQQIPTWLVILIVIIFIIIISNSRGGGFGGPMIFTGGGFGGGGYGGGGGWGGGGGGGGGGFSGGGGNSAGGGAGGSW